jgi:hypothetical protein
MSAIAFSCLCCDVQEFLGVIDHLPSCFYYQGDQTMLKKDEINNQHSCLNSAADDEPVFVLRGNDELAPQVIRAWARVYKAAKGVNITEKQTAKYTEALQSADKMEAWKKMKMGSMTVDEFGHHWEGVVCSRCKTTKDSPVADRLCEPKEWMP